MNCVCCDICVYHLWFCLCFFPGVFLSSRVTGACPVTTDLILRVNMRTTNERGRVKCRKQKLGLTACTRAISAPAKLHARASFFRIARIFVSDTGTTVVYAWRLPMCRSAQNDARATRSQT